MLLINDWTDVRPRFACIVHDQSFHTLRQCADKSVVNAFRHDKPRRCRATLSRRKERAVYGRLNCDAEVGIVQYDQGILTAHFQLKPGHSANASMRHFTPCRHGAGKRDGIHGIALQQSFADDCSPPHHQIENTVRQTRSRDNLCKSMCGARNKIGWLEHNCIAIAERRCNLPGGNGDWEIPRRDDADRTDGLSRNFYFNARSDARQLISGETERFTRKKSENLTGAGDFADSLGQRLAFFARQQLSELFTATDNFVRNFFKQS